MFYVCFFLPASFSILVSEKLRKEKRSLSDLVIPYLAYTFLITTIMNTIINIVSKSETPWYAESMFTFQFSMEYTWLSLLIAIILPCLVYVISKVVQINIDVKERTKGVTKDAKKDLKKDTKDSSENYKRKH